MNHRFLQIEASSEWELALRSGFSSATIASSRRSLNKNDFGKDAYVDLAHDRYFTPLCIAIQVKSGTSYRSSSGDYFIPLDQHAHTWRNSTVPVFGVVFDPDDEFLRWIDLTAYLRANPAQNTGRVLISRDALLTTQSLANGFADAVREYVKPIRSEIAMSLLSDDPATQHEDVIDAWALGRGDARFLTLLKRLIVHLDVQATRRAIWTLSHATPHPDIFWTADNWLPDAVRWQVQRSFRWSSEELEHLFLAIGPDEWGRGTLGQSLHMLLLQDVFVWQSLDCAIANLLSRSELERAVLCVWVVLASAENPLDTLNSLVEKHSILLESEWVQEIRVALSECNEFDIY